MGKYGESGLQSGKRVSGQFAGADQSQAGERIERNTMSRYIFMLEVFTDERPRESVRDTVREILGKVYKSLDEDDAEDACYLTRFRLIDVAEAHVPVERPDDELVRAWEKLLGEPLC